MAQRMRLPRSCEAGGRGLCEQECQAGIPSSWGHHAQEWNGWRRPELHLAPARHLWAQLMRAALDSLNGSTSFLLYQRLKCPKAKEPMSKGTFLLSSNWPRLEAF